MQQLMPLGSLNNLDLTTKMFTLTQRYGELTLWLEQTDRKIFDMICTDKQVVSLSLQKEIELKHQADTERYVVLSQLKQIELEMDRRVN